MLPYNITPRFKILALILVLNVFRINGCQVGEVETFERITGMIPLSVNNTLLLNHALGPESLVLDCIHKCQAAGDKCVAFVVDYNQYACFSIDVPIPDDLFGFSPLQYSRIEFQTSMLVYFEKICIKAPGCGKVAWMLERVPGFELRSEQAITIRGITSRQACAALCLSEKRFACHSANFDAAWLDCRLSGEDRRSQPYAFVPSIGPVDYLENVCAQFQHSSTEVCAFEEFRDVALNQTDMSFINVSKQECRRLCDVQAEFRCRGYSYAAQDVLSVITKGSVCLLHSADVTSSGPNSLVPLRGATYSERAPCLELLLRCSKNDVSIKLRTKAPFYGRLFVQGHSDVCDTTGKGANETQLIVTTDCANFTEEGVNVNVVMQYSPIIQRRGDRALNIYCQYGDALLASVNSTIQVQGDPFFGGQLSVNSSDQASAAVRIRITDLQGNQASITEVGKDLELRIEAVNTDPFDISAGQLIASNLEGTESVLLLDERGCPPDPGTFPALQKINGTKDLVAHFRAFRFTSSTVVRFFVRVHFCLQSCPEVKCANGGKSYTRQRRAHTTTPASYVDYPHLDQAVISSNLLHASHSNFTFSKPSKHGFPNDMPLEMDILVLPDPHSVININSNHSVITARDPAIDDFDTTEEKFEGWCVSESVFISVLVIWILLQIILVITVWMAASAYVKAQPVSSVRLRNVKWDEQAFN